MIKSPNIEVTLYGKISGGSSMGLAPHLNFCQPHQLAPSAKLVYYIYLVGVWILNYQII